MLCNQGVDGKGMVGGEGMITLVCLHFVRSSDLQFNRNFGFGKRRIWIPSDRQSRQLSLRFLGVFATHRIFHETVGVPLIGGKIHTTADTGPVARWKESVHYAMWFTWRRSQL